MHIFLYIILAVVLFVFDLCHLSIIDPHLQLMTAIPAALRSPAHAPAASIIGGGAGTLQIHAVSGMSAVFRGVGQLTTP